MRNRSLHQALHAFAEQAALQLAADAAGGAEVPFELTESRRGARTPLYCYQPLIDEFIRERVGVIGRLPTYVAAGRALDQLSGLDAYLRARGQPRVPADHAECVDAVLRTFLEAMFAESSDFEFSEERFERAHAELEAVVYQSRTLTTVIAPVLGLELESEELALGDGLAIVRGDAFAEAPPEAVWTGGAEGAGPSTLMRLTVEEKPGSPAPVSAARMRFRRLLTSLRLFDSAGFALGPAGWMRVDAGPWQLIQLGGSGRARGTPLTVLAAQEDELRAFCNLIAKRVPGAGGRPGHGEVAWALARFEMGCGRLSPFEMLTDHLLALRALLEPEGPGSGRLAQRLAAICAPPERRAVVAERTAHAISLERAVVAGLAPAEPNADALVEEVSGHLRALLRDVLCGHLNAELCAVADSLLEEQTTDEVEEVPEPVSGQAN